MRVFDTVEDEDERVVEGFEAGVELGFREARQGRREVGVFTLAAGGRPGSAFGHEVSQDFGIASGLSTYDEASWWRKRGSGQVGCSIYRRWR